MNPQILRVRGFEPQIAPDVFIADNARIIGAVVIGEKSSIWFNVTIRGDVMPIVIGKETNIQDGAVIHGTFGKAGVQIGDRVTVGHLAMLHGCEIGRCTLIGMSSTIMDQVSIGEYSIVGAGSVVTQGSVFPPRSLIVGSPARVKRELTEEEIRFLDQSADNYLLYKTWYENADVT